MSTPDTAQTYVAALARRARLFVRAHGEEIAQAAVVAAAAAALLVAASYLAWAWRDVGYACEARHSAHCTAPIADPALRAARDLGCRVRAGDCGTGFVWVAARALAGDVLDAVAAAWARAKARLFEVALALALVLFSVAAARQVLLWLGQPLVFLASFAQAGSSAKSSGSADVGSSGGGDGGGRQ